MEWNWIEIFTKTIGYNLSGKYLNINTSNVIRINGEPKASFSPSQNLHQIKAKYTFTGKIKFFEGTESIFILTKDASLISTIRAIVWLRNEKLNYKKISYEVKDYINNGNFRFNGCKFENLGFSASFDWKGKTYSFKHHFFKGAVFDKKLPDKWKLEELMGFFICYYKAIYMVNKELDAMEKKPLVASGLHVDSNVAELLNDYNELYNKEQFILNLKKK